MRSLAILAAALAALPLPAQAAEPPLDFAWPVIRVIDGDRLAVDASADLPAPLAQLRVRLRGIDAPEAGHRAGCDAERESAGRAARAAAHLLDEAETVIVRGPVWGKWGGRVVADVILDGERSLAALLVRADHARPYDGGARAGWCGTPEGVPPEAGAAGTGPDVTAAAPAGDAPAARCELHGDLDALLACYDRERAAAPPAATGLRAEIERHVIEPCIEVALAEGIAAPGIVQRNGAASLADAAKIAAAPMLAGLTETLRPYLTQGGPEFRMKAYDVFRDICLIGLRRQIAGGGAWRAAERSSPAGRAQSMRSPDRACGALQSRMNDSVSAQHRRVR